MNLICVIDVAVKFSRASCNVNMPSVGSVNLLKNARQSKLPYVKPKFNRKPKVTTMPVDEDVLKIHTDADDEKLLSDPVIRQVSSRALGVSTDVRKSPVNIDIANAEMMILLQEIRNSQCTKEDVVLLKEIRNSQCTKDDLHAYGEKISEKFGERFTAMDRRVEKSEKSIGTIESRLYEIESTLRQNDFDSELAKQNLLSNNITVMGIPYESNEDLSSLLLRLFALIKCQFARADFFGCYRIKRANAYTDMFVAKLNDFNTKQKVLKAKTAVSLKLSDVVGASGGGADPFIFINSQVTPFFGRLMSEGRKAVKEKKLHSVWLNRHGCQLRLVADGPEIGFKSLTELNELVLSNGVSVPRSDRHLKRSRSEDDDLLPRQQARRPRK